MVAIMAKPDEYTTCGNPQRDGPPERALDELVVLAKSQAGALGQLYELYYERIFRFCVHRLFNRATAEDVTSTVFLTVAKMMRGFKGRTEQDFRAWIYTIAANQANAYIRKTSRRKRLMENVVAHRRASEQDASEGEWSSLDWPTLYAAIQQLKPEHQTLLTLRYFENMDYDEIGRVVATRPATVRVILHRVLHRLGDELRGDLGGEEQ